MTGEVNATIYFGTPYDWQNIPFHSYNIAVHSERNMQVKGTFVWQTTWLETLRINVEDYNDIVGAQWLVLEETDPLQDYGQHWYYIIDYVQETNKTCYLTLKYDPLLSIGVDAITGVSGTMSRWTVDDDSVPDYWVMTDEPINQAFPFEYRYKLITGHVKTSVTQLIGCGVNLSQKPKILNYTNPESEEKTNIFYPDLSSAPYTTNFSIQFPGSRNINDGLLYNYWTGENIKKNYSLAVGLGYDLVTKAYSMPVSDLITYTAGDAGIANIKTTKGDYNFNLPLYDSSVNNAKAGAMNRTVTLFSPSTGESISAMNYEIGTTSIAIWVDPTFNGCFHARFSNLRGLNASDNDIRSSGWMEITLTSNIGAGTLSANLQNEMTRAQQDVNKFQARNQMITDIGTSALGMIPALMSKDKSLIGYQGTQAVNQIFQSITAYSNFNHQLNLERENLRVTGTINTNTPPGIKLGEFKSFDGLSYKFYVRLATLSDQDIYRADIFFTQYGYNVDRYPLTDINQLNCRSRFTYIMADDVRITAGATPARIRDQRTVNGIKERFSNGIRIWQVKPDYEWETPNPTR